MKKWLLFLIMFALCISLSFQSIYASVTVNDKGASVGYPAEGEVVWIPQAGSNVTAYGSGFMNYTVVTGAEELILYEKQWMYIDATYTYVSDSETFSPNSTTDVEWTVVSYFHTKFFSAADAGAHTAKITLSLTDIFDTTIATVSDIHNFTVEVDAQAPDVTVSFPDDGASRTATWSATDPTPGSGLHSLPYRYKLNGGSWSSWTSATSHTFTGLNPGGTYTVTVEARDKVGNVGSNSDTSLQVELSAFTALETDGKITLYWRTETEVGNIGFRVYRSTQPDGPFTKRGFIAGAGNSAMPRDYQWTDTRVQAGQTYYYYIEDIDVVGVKTKSDIISIVVPPAKPALPIPSNFALLQNYPNPFNPDTWIPYQLAQEAEPMIKFFNVIGELVRAFNLGQKPAGNYLSKDRAAYWDGRDSLGEKVASGVYYYTLQAGEFRATRKMVIMK